MALCVCCVFDLLQEIKPAQRNRKQQEATESNGTNARSRAKAPPLNPNTWTALPHQSKN